MKCKTCSAVTLMLSIAGIFIVHLYLRQQNQTNTYLKFETENAISGKFEFKPNLLVLRDRLAKTHQPDGLVASQMLSEYTSGKKICSNGTVITRISGTADSTLLIHGICTED